MSFFEFGFLFEQAAAIFYLNGVEKFWNFQRFYSGEIEVFRQKIEHKGAVGVELVREEERVLNDEIFTT